MYYHPDTDISVQVLKALYRAGIRVVEYANRGQTAVDSFFQLRKVIDKELPDMFLGAGMIKNKIAATEFINEGADFIVSPFVVREVANLVHDNNLLWIPTCMGPTDITKAEDLGATIIKLFPANTLGVSYVRDIKEIFPDLLFIPTGEEGHNEENVHEWFEAGSSVVGLGRKFLKEDLIERGDYETIESLTRDALNTVQKIKGR